jgi:small-conductance mechanosensitive channel
MEEFFDPAKLQTLGLEAWQWFIDQVLVWPTAVQAGVVILALLVARWVAPSLARVIEQLQANPKCPRWLHPAMRAISPLCFAIVWLVLQWFSVFATRATNSPGLLIEIVVSLLSAWIVIRFASGFIRNRGWARTLAIITWSVAALNIVGLLDATMETLDAMAFSIGDIRLSVLGLLKAGVVLAVFLWLAGAISRQVETALTQANALSPSARVLLGKLLHILLIVVAVVAALESMGVDLTALAVFGGAIGLGLGFGLQKVISNLVSGMILLMDKSVKPGDVIAIDDTFGWINRLSARYVSVITRDGTEHLIPNEDLISQRVENWSYSDSLIRLKLPIGIAYESNVPKAMELAVEAATGVDRVLLNPKPVCRLMNFGSDSVELELRVWIEDPQKGVANVRSDVLLNVWNAYHDGGIEFPFSQRDLHLRSAVPLDVTVSKKNLDPD